MTDQNLPRTADADQVELAWRTSSYSGNNGGQCVEVALRTGAPPEWLIRDSKDPEGAVLVFSPAQWETFIAGVRAL